MIRSSLLQNQLHRDHNSTESTLEVSSDELSETRELSNETNVKHLQYGLSGAGLNLYPVMQKKTKVASSLKNSPIHINRNGNVASTKYTIIRVK